MDLRSDVDRLRATIKALRLWQEDRVRKLVYTVDRSMIRDNALDMLLAKWLFHPETLRQHQHTIKHLQQEIAKPDEQRTTSGGQLSALYAKHTDTMHANQDYSERAGKEANRDLEELWASLDALSDRRSRLECELALTLEHESQMLDLTLEIADDALVNAGLMAPPNAPRESFDYEVRLKGLSAAFAKSRTPSHGDSPTQRKESLPRSLPKCETEIIFRTCRRSFKMNDAVSCMTPSAHGPKRRESSAKPARTTMAASHAS